MSLLFHDDSEVSDDAPPAPPSPISVVDTPDTHTPVKPKRKRPAKKKAAAAAAEMRPEDMFKDWFEVDQDSMDESPSQAKKRKKRKASPEKELFEGVVIPEIELPKLDENYHRRREEYRARLEAAEVERVRLKKISEVLTLRTSFMLLSNALPLWTRRGIGDVPDMCEGYAQVDWPMLVRCGRIFDAQSSLINLWNDVMSTKPLMVRDLTLIPDRETAARIDQLEQEIKLRRRAAKDWILSQLGGAKTRTSHVIEYLEKTTDIRSIEIPEYFTVKEADREEAERLLTKYFDSETRERIMNETSEATPKEEISQYTDEEEDVAMEEPQEEEEEGDEAEPEAEPEPELEPEAGPISDNTPPSNDPAADAENEAQRNARVAELRLRMKEALLKDAKKTEKLAFVEDAAEESADEASHAAANSEEDADVSDAEAEEVLEMFEFDEEAIAKEKGDDKAVQELLRQQLEERDERIYEKLFKKGASEAVDDVTLARNTRRLDLSAREEVAVSLSALSLSKQATEVIQNEDHEERASEDDESFGSSDHENAITSPRLNLPYRDHKSKRKAVTGTCAINAENANDIIARVLNG